MRNKIIFQYLIYPLLFLYSCNNVSNDKQKESKILISSYDSVYFNIISLGDEMEYFFSSYGKKHGLYVKKDSLMRISSKKIYYKDLLLLEKRYSRSETFDTVQWLKYERKKEGEFEKQVVTELLKVENSKSYLVNVLYRPLTPDARDTFSIETKNIDHIETLDSKKEITKYDWRDPWFRFSSTNKAKFIVSDLEPGANIYKYNIALIKELEINYDSLTYETTMLPIYIPIIRVDDNLYNKVSNQYFIRDWYW